MTFKKGALMAAFAVAVGGGLAVSGMALATGASLLAVGELLFNTAAFGSIIGRKIKRLSKAENGPQR
jgi:hypothetical protein